ncbi:MAG: hypothetical protein HY422_01395 [Candidatus Komeilibacteria bacterium]|nr:hypothetical protein [Candidatus Komeilibacteria bacterium]
MQNAAEAKGQPDALDVFGAGIQVSGNARFESFRWREAILYYLNGVWRNDLGVMYRPKIRFGNVMPGENKAGAFIKRGITLRLDGHSYSGRYYAYGTSEQRVDAIDKTSLFVECRQADVEGGLIRFVKDEALDSLAISFGRSGIRLTKSRRRGELAVEGFSIPSSINELE